MSIGDYLLTETGGKVGPTKQGVQALIDQDPNARWDGTKVTGSCAPSLACGPFSPRIIAMAVYDPDEFQLASLTNNWSNCPGGGQCIHIRSFLGFFVDHLDGNDVAGYLILYPGILTTSPNGIGAPSAFARVITLVR